MVSADTDALATALIIICGIIGLIFGLVNYYLVARVQLGSAVGAKDSLRSRDTEAGRTETQVVQEMIEIGNAISEGAQAFLFAEYKYIVVFLACMIAVIWPVLDSSNDNGGLVTVSFIIGAFTSIVSGYIGMRIAVYANVRVAFQAWNGIGPAFVCAIRAGGVMGFALTSLALLVLLALIALFRIHFVSDESFLGINDDFQKLYEAVAGYGLGGSCVALFGRVGGGIYTKAADVGADLVGKVEQGIPEDDPRNPAVIADNVGDNVGDIAGMGADLFGSFAEATCAALVVASTSPELKTSWSAMCYPLLISATGIIVCILTSFVATTFYVVRRIEDIEKSLKYQLIISTVLMTPVAFGVSYGFLPSEFHVTANVSYQYHAAICVLCGLWSGLLIGYITEYFTSHSYAPVRDVANSCNTGAATNIIYGLALGYKSVIIPVFALAITIYVNYTLCGMFGIALGALGMLSTLATGLTIDAYGPISDNAGGIAEMAGLGEETRKRTDALDAAGNTTAAIGKGFAIGSAALVSLALFGAFITRAQVMVLDIAKPLQFASLLVGAMLPYAFSALTMKSVGKAALEMVQEVRRQFREIPGLMERRAKPDYKKCVAISTTASLKEMILPGAMVILSPIITGILFGEYAVGALLCGALVSGVQMAISSSNTGGAWDNAKKYIESGHFGGKHSAPHAAAVIGDTVGDPLKDTSGPSLNILIKLMAIVSLVFGGFFKAHGGVLFGPIGASA